MRRSTVNKSSVCHKGFGYRDVALLGGLVLVVALIVLVAHWPALSAKALCFDDGEYLLNNALVQNPSGSAAGRFLTEVFEPSTVGGYYQPLAMISLMLDCARGGSAEDLRPFHETSLALHVCNTALVVVLLYMLFESAWVAAMVGLLFGVHPMTVEPIPWVGERKTLLAAFFSLWCLIAYVRYTRTQSWISYLGCMALYVLALMSKPTSTMLPVVMLVLDYWPLRRLRWRCIGEKVPFFVIGGVSAIITFISQARTAGVETPAERSLLNVVLTVCHNIVFYLYKIVWPANLSSHYPFPGPMSVSHPMVLAGVIGTCLLVAGLLLSLRWTRSLLAGWLIFFVAIFPTLGVIGFTNVIASNKFAYLPSVGLLFVLTWFLVRLWTSEWSRLSRRIRRVGLVVVVGFLATAEIASTRQQLYWWQNTERLYRYMIDLAPNSAFLYDTLGVVLSDMGKADEALACYHKALEIVPDFFMAHCNLGVDLAKNGELDSAVEHLARAVRLRPNDSYIRNNMGLVLAQSGKAREAIEHYTEALRVDPLNYRALANLGDALAKCDRNDEALKCCREAIRINPRYCVSYRILGDILVKCGKTDEAVVQYKEALRLNPRNCATHNELGLALIELNEPEQALRCYAEALRLCPDYESAHNNLGVALVRVGKVDQAIEHFKEAVRLDVGYVDARYNLASCLEKLGRVDEAIANYVLVVERDPEYHKAYNNLGLLLERKGEIGRAVDYQMKAVQIAPASPHSHYNLAHLLVLQGKLDEALGHYRKAVQIEPHFAAAYVGMVSVLVHRGDLDGAIQSLRSALKVQPKNAHWHCGLGDLLVRQGQLDEAAEAYRRALTLDPQHANARQGLTAVRAKRNSSTGM